MLSVWKCTLVPNFSMQIYKKILSARGGGPCAMARLAPWLIRPWMIRSDSPVCTLPRPAALLCCSGSESAARRCLPFSSQCSSY